MGEQRLVVPFWLLALKLLNREIFSHKRCAPGASVPGVFYGRHHVKEHIGGKVSTAEAAENAKRADFGDLNLI